MAQGLAHPDRWSGKPPDQQNIAARLSSLVNDAYTTLNNPVRRAFYILEREGFHHEGEESIDDPTLIMDILEQHENLEHAQSQEEVDAIRAENKDEYDAVVQRISELVEARNWQEVKNNSIALKYRQGIDLAAKAWPDKAQAH